MLISFTGSDSPTFLLSRSLYDDGVRCLRTEFTVMRGLQFAREVVN